MKPSAAIMVRTAVGSLEGLKPTGFGYILVGVFVRTAVGSLEGLKQMIDALDQIARGESERPLAP